MIIIFSVVLLGIEIQSLNRQKYRFCLQLPYVLHLIHSHILHGDIDQRLDYQSSVDFYNYAKAVGADIELETFENADHTEGMLTETERYAETLASFFKNSLSD